MVRREKDEELTLFLEMRRKERNKDLLLLNNLSLKLDDHDHDHDHELGSNETCSSNNSGGGVSPAPELKHRRRTAVDNFLNSEGDKSEYEWLITPPSTPLFHSLENETQKTKIIELGVSHVRPNVLKQRITNVQEEPASRNVVASKNLKVSSGFNGSIISNRRPSSSGGLKSTSRPATPTGRPTLPATSKPSRASTPTRSTSRSSTPTARPSVLASKSGPASRSSSVTKSTPTISKIPSPSRGITPAVKSRPWKPSDMPGFSHDAPPNLRTSVPERPVSASRGRPGGAPSSRSPSVEAKVRPRQQSCSPSRGRPSNGSIPSIRRTRVLDGDDVNPVVMGTKMVERVVNMRKLAPPKQDVNVKSTYGITGGKSSSHGSLGFGRNLSKNSLDMAMRHMDITRSISGNLRSTITRIPASSMYTVRSGFTKSRTPSVLDSPLATSSNASSELSINDIATENVKLYSYNSLRSATRNFHPSNRIGGGGYGVVYKGILRDGTHAAIKCLSAESKQGTHEFLTEINMISTIRHPNLVGLIGCCVEGTHRILIYEYLENNSIASVLLGSKSKVHLDWPQRVAICLGTASGLAFLHDEAEPPIVHRDVKASNVLLDGNFEPKIGDFGLAKLFPDNVTHISTRVAGTVGYLAPEYALMGQLTKKADVFSFGVLLLELVSGRSSSKAAFGEDLVVLVEWTWELKDEGRLLEIVDPELAQYPENEILRFIKVALFCTQGAANQRPNMKQVVDMLSKDVNLNEKALTEPQIYTGGRKSKNSGHGSSEEASVNPVLVTMSTSHSVTQLLPR
ncbi:hypothetical protein ACFE04_030574 [Oxalis oulophora]